MVGLAFAFQTMLPVCLLMSVPVCLCIYVPVQWMSSNYMAIKIHLRHIVTSKASTSTSAPNISFFICIGMWAAAYLHLRPLYFSCFIIDAPKEIAFFPPGSEFGLNVREVCLFSHHQGGLALFPSGWFDSRLLYS